MRKAIALLGVLLLLAACSGEDKAAARKKKITGYKAELKALNGEYAAMRSSPEHTAAKAESAKAMMAFAIAKKRDDAAALETAQAAYEEAVAAAEVILAQEAVLEKKMQDMRDKILDLGGTP